MFVGASFGGMLLPWLIGQYFETVGPHSAMVIMLVDMVGLLWDFRRFELGEKKSTRGEPTGRILNGA